MSQNFRQDWEPEAEGIYTVANSILTFNTGHSILALLKYGMFHICPFGRFPVDFTTLKIAT